nr:malto-oligosyltrehalose trehalohydrolase [Rubrobacter sp.]
AYGFEVADGLVVPDPASRAQQQDVHGPSLVPGPIAADPAWRGRPWAETVLYELHIGTFTAEGTLAAAARELPALADLGITAVELMPLAAYSGSRGWGYDGVLPYAVHGSYGTPDDLAAFVAAAHRLGLMVFLDVVYNHFGPEGNYLNLYAPQFFTDRHETPWGAAINFDGAGSWAVREYFINNALYWLEEYHLDGLRLDAVHAILDDSGKHFLTELSERVEAGPGADRHVHLVLENDANNASYLRAGTGSRRPAYTAQWNDDLHHALHAAVTGESAGYYEDYAGAPVAHLGRCLAEGFAFQGEPSPFRGGERRGEPSADLPPTAFVSFAQNHDQVGNRAFGDRLSELAPAEALRAAAAIYLLAPQVPMIFMGEEWATTAPFPFFCDFEPGLAPLVTEGRREEFSKFPEFNDPATRDRIPDPAAPETFRLAVLDPGRQKELEQQGWIRLYQELLGLRREEVVPRLRDVPGGQSLCRVVGKRGLRVQWTLGDGSLLTLLANLGPEPAPGFGGVEGRLLYATDREAPEAERELPAWSVAWYLKDRA